MSYNISTKIKLSESDFIILMKSEFPNIKFNKEYATVSANKLIKRWTGLMESCGNDYVGKSSRIAYGKMVDCYKNNLNEITFCEIYDESEMLMTAFLYIPGESFNVSPSENIESSIVMELINRICRAINGNYQET